MQNEITSAKAHWDEIYKTKTPSGVSWYKPHLDPSLNLILKAGVGKEGRMIDIGGGASTLADDLLAKGFKNVMVLDLSSGAIAIAKARLAALANQVVWIEADITQVSLPEKCYDLWHDRALFHFLTLPQDRRRYAEQVRRSLKSGGHLIIAAFNLHGPTRCSGLDIVQYSPEKLLAELGSDFKLIESFTEEHHTPAGGSQEFVYCYFRKS